MGGGIEVGRGETGQACVSDRAWRPEWTGMCLGSSMASLADRHVYLIEPGVLSGQACVPDRGRRPEWTGMCLGSITDPRVEAEGCESGRSGVWRSNPPLRTSDEESSLPYASQEARWALWGFSP